MSVLQADRARAPARGRASRVRAVRERVEPAHLVLAALVLAGALLRFWRLGQQGLWYDEGNSALLVHQSFGGMISLIPQTESTPPLYYMLAWLWARIFGFGEAGLRSLSALAGVLTIPFAWRAGTRLVSPRAGLLVAALTAFNPFLIWYAQEARSYALMVLFTAAALAAFASAHDRPTRGPLTAWAGLAGLALCTHYLAALVLVPQAVLLLRRHRARRSVLLAIGFVALVGLALAPLALTQDGTGRDSWIHGASLRLRLAQLLPQALIGTGSPQRLLVKYLAFALAAGTLVLLARHVRSRERAGALRAGGIALGGLGLALGLVAVGSDTLITRNLIALWLPAAILLAGGMSAPRPRGLGGALAGGLCLIGVVAAVGVATTRDLQRPDWRPVARLLGARPGHGSRLILIQHYRELLPLSLMLPGLQFDVLRSRPGVREIDVIGASAPQQPFCWWGATCNLIPSRVQRHYNIPGFHTRWRRHERRFTIVRLTADAPRTVTADEVAATLHTTSLARDILLFQP